MSNYTFFTKKICIYQCALKCCSIALFFFNPLYRGDNAVSELEPFIFSLTR
jgi:hypothetical protein